MALKERNQNAVVGDTLRLRMWTFASNNFADPSSVNGLDVYVLDPVMATVANPDGRTLVQSLGSGSVVREAEGKYYADLSLASPTYAQGTYIDSWSVTYGPGDDPVANDQYFTVYPPLWITSPGPVLYDFTFTLYPNRIVKGEVKNIIVTIHPNVPKATDLERYYYNLAVLGDITFTIIQRCGPCLPPEEELRTVVEDAPADYRERCQAFYKLDTTELDCGIYDVQVKFQMGGNTYYSERLPFQIYS